jgi:cytochrome c
MTLLASLVLTNVAWGQSAPPATGALPPGNAEAGQTVFKKCLACHQIGAGAHNSIGPVLNGVIGRPAGTYPGYDYSDANKSSGVVWTEDALARYLPSPKDMIPGTKMSFAGLKMPQDVADVIAYLKQFDADGNKVAAGN